MDDTVFVLRSAAGKHAPTASRCGPGLVGGLRTREEVPALRQGDRQASKGDIVGIFVPWPRMNETRTTTQVFLIVYSWFCFQNSSVYLIIFQVKTLRV